MFNRKILISGVSILSALTMLGSSAFAVFSSSASNTGNTFGAGNMVLAINGAAASASTTLFTFPSVAPGDVKDQPITLTNTGSVGSNTTMLTSIGHSTSSSPDLGDKLTLQIYDDLDNSGTVTAGDTLLGTGHINDGSWSNVPLGFGLPATVGTHKIVARVTFDSDATDAYQATNSTFSLNFSTSQ